MAVVKETENIALVKCYNNIRFNNFYFLHKIIWYSTVLYVESLNFFSKNEHKNRLLKHWCNYLMSNESLSIIHFARSVIVL